MVSKKKLVAAITIVVAFAYALTRWNRSDDPLEESIEDADSPIEVN